VSAIVTSVICSQMSKAIQETVDAVHRAQSKRLGGLVTGIFHMVGSALIRMMMFTLAGLSAAASSAADYRGMSTGWPPFANGYYAANYPTNYGAGAAYYVARPVMAAGYAAQSPSGAMYVPTTAAYANPTYFAAYGRSPVAYRPVSTAGYAPAAAGYAPSAAGYYAPVTTSYAPVTANYAPSNSYAVTPAGLGSAGSEAAAYFGQPTPLNYVAPRVAYRTTYMPVPVYMYRPVTTYQPMTGQPVTCLQASTCSTCQPQRTHVWWNPLTWFRHSGCGSPPPTTSYCGTGCPQPYYPVQPVVPIVPAPAVTVPQNVIPSMPAQPSRTIPIYPAQPTVPPPPTGAIVPSPGMTTPVPARTIPGSNPGAADFPPRFTPGTATPGPIITPVPGTTVPSPGFTPLSPGTTPGGPPASGSFPIGPSPPPTPQPGFGAPGFGSGTNYAPTVDPYSATMTPSATPYGAAYGTAPTNYQSGANQPSGPPHSVFGSGYRGGSLGRSDAPQSTTGGVIRAPELGPALPPSVQTVPDLDAPQLPRAPSNAPSLLDPRDKTAGGTHRWAVVPAQWPTQYNSSGQLADHPATPLKAHEPSHSAAEYDDRGWRSASF
jgi:hypothetical protein